MKSAFLSISLFLFASTADAQIVSARDSTASQFPVTPKAKHEIGFVCLKEIQNAACYEAFGIYDVDGKEMPKPSPPNWARFGDGKPLSAQDWEKVPSKMVGYDTHGFEVMSIDANRVQLGFPDVTKKVWVPQKKVQVFTKTEDLSFCSFGGKDWWKDLYEADLKTPAKVDLSKSIPGDPFKGLEPIGTLLVTRNNKSEICGSSGCAPGKVDVDPKSFEVSKTTPVRSNIGAPNKLNLGFEHFEGSSDMSNVESNKSVDRLVVWDRRGSNQFLLKATIYNSPKIWVTIPSQWNEAVKFVPASEATLKTFFKRDGSEYPNFTKQFQDGADIQVSSSKWVNSELWLEIKVSFDLNCEPQPILEGKYLGTYWIRYSEKLGTCPKGC